MSLCLMVTGEGQNFRFSSYAQEYHPMGLLDGLEHLRAAEGQQQSRRKTREGAQAPVTQASEGRQPPRFERQRTQGWSLGCLKRNKRIVTEIDNKR